MVKHNLWVIFIPVVAVVAISGMAFASYYMLTKPVPATANIVAAIELDPSLLGIYEDQGCTQTLNSFDFEAPPGWSDTVDCYLRNESQQTLYVKVSDDFALGEVTMSGLASS